MSKKEIIDELYNKFNSYTTTEKKGEYIDLFGYDILINRAYKDLEENWSNEHADIFIDALTNLFNQAGII